MQELERWITDVILGDVRGFRAWITRISLRLLSGIFRASVQTRKFLFRQNFKQSHHLGTLTISVGNLTLGGTGKTPVVELLAKALAARGRKVAILSRGYKSRALRKPQQWVPPEGKKPLPPEAMPKIVSTGADVLLDSRFAGDEPFMLAKNLPEVAMFVDRDRVKSARFAIDQWGADTLLLDDGMQYIRLARALDICLVDSTAPFGTGAMLPAGTLREPKKNLRRAHFIMLTKSDGSGHEELIRKLRKYNATAPIIITRHGPKYLQNLVTGEQRPLSYLQGKHIAALSGIAVPENFEKSLVKLGAIVDIKKRFSDHHRFSKNEIRKFTQRCLERDVAMIVMTEKDAVRYPLDLGTVPLWYLRIAVEILSGQEHWEHMLDTICTPVSEADNTLRYCTEFSG